MARCHLSRQLSLLSGKLCNSYGLLPLARSTVSSTQGLNKNLLNFTATNHVATSSLARNLALKPVPQLNLLRSIATSQPHSAAVTGDHVRLWQIERITSAVLIGLLPACVLVDNPVVDVSLAVLMVMHSHWGLEAIVIDYARPIVVGNVFPKIAHLALNIFSAAMLAGLLVMIYNGPGLGKTVKNFWAIGKDEDSK